MLKKRYRKAQFIVELILLTIIFSLCILIGFESQNLDLKEADKITSIVADRGIDSERGIKGKTAKIFYIKLKDLDQRLTVFRTFRNYDAFVQKINIGDTVTVYYYSRIYPKKNIDFTLLQLERNRIILIPKSKYENKESLGIYVGIGGLIGTFLFFIYNRKKHFRSRKNPATIRLTKDQPV